jgi:hypothetical protein
MSWSVSAQGKPVAVRDAIAKQFAAISCTQPEEDIKESVAESIASALSFYPPDVPVKVIASGSQQDPDWGKKTEENRGLRINSLSVSIEPIWGFLE